LNEGDKEANKDLESGLSLTVYVDDNNFVLYIVYTVDMIESDEPAYQYSDPYNFSTVEELKTWIENVLPTLEVEYVY
jgi:hypothetical protein